MRKSVIVSGVAMAAVIGLSGQALALGVGDLAKVVLGNGSVIKKADEKCGTSLGLTGGDRLTLSSAYSAVERALSKKEYTALNNSTTSAAETASQSSTFCNETKVKKKGMLSKIGKAAKGLLGKRLGL
jgi:hypothetical protein